MRAIIALLKYFGIWSGLKRACLDLRTWCYSFKYSDEKSMEKIYTKEYFNQNNYSKETPLEKTIKEAQSEYILRAVAPKKVLVAGCAAGELVRALRQKGMEAFGFDISPDLAAIAYPDVAQFLRPGSMNNIPFGPGDGFDVLVAFDVFEHVPYRLIEKMVLEINRLAPKYLVTIIAHDSYYEVGHITLKSLKWWEKMFKVNYRIKNTKVDLKGIPEVYSVKEPELLIKIWERVLD